MSLTFWSLFTILVPIFITISLVLAILGYAIVFIIFYKEYIKSMNS